MTVFPNKVISQTTYNEEINPPFAILTVDPEDVSRAYKNWLIEKTQQTGFCSCVTFVKRLTGYDKSVGTAKNWPINTKTPTVGGVVVTNESPSGHVAYIMGVNGNLLTVKEANWVHCKLTTRTINTDDRIIKGFWEVGD